MRAMVLLLAGLLLAGCVQVPFSLPDTLLGDNILNGRSVEVKRFASAEEFREYMLGASEVAAFAPRLTRMSTAVVESLHAGAVGMGYGGGYGGEFKAPRRSTTNVQVAGIDEPDVLKNDGEVLYISGTSGVKCSSWTKCAVPYGYGVTLVHAYPPQEMRVLSRVPEAGNLLLAERTLVVIEPSSLTAYSVADREEPERLWRMELTGRLVSARLREDKLYLVVEKQVSEYTPCEMRIASTQGESVTLSCTEVYHPEEEAPASAVYALLEVDAPSGKVLRKTGFLGATGSSVVYVSHSAVYVSYPLLDYAYPLEEYERMLDSILPEELRQEVERVSGYRLSPKLKLEVYNRILQSYLSELSPEEAQEVKEVIYTSTAPGYGGRVPSSRTGIVKLSLNSFTAEGSTVLDGRLLNQFSLDEYEGYLRVALSRGYDNAVVVLDSDMKVVGTLGRLGKKGERIFGVRFAGDRGYVVTFRQTDPFYVIDLSSPENPRLEGELELPGYSAYLHPLQEELVLGVGVEGGRVKLSLFDVSMPAEPVELSKYVLSAGHSEVLANHRAFLLDEQRQVFFLPASSGGYVFSYAGGKLKLLAEVEAKGVRRAAYIGDYMYIVGWYEVKVLDMRTWEVVETLRLRGYKEGMAWK